MPSCTVCIHPNRVAINKALLSGEASAYAIAAANSLNRESVRRHLNNHLQASTGAINETKNALTIIAMANELFERASGVLTTAEQALATSDGNPRAIQAASGSLREVRQSIELLAKLVVVEPEPESASTNALLDSMILARLQEMELPELPAGAEIQDAVILP